MALEHVLIARPAPDSGGADALLLPALANRHGLIAGATGTGKTVTLQRLVEQFSRLGVPTLLADVKGDLSGLAAPGVEKAAFAERRVLLGLPAAYSISRFTQKRLALFILLARLMPGISFLMPWYIIFSRLGLMDTYVAQIGRAHV